MKPGQRPGMSSDALRSILACCAIGAVLYLACGVLVAAVTR